jgi:hypothetical protein
MNLRAPSAWRAANRDVGAACRLPTRMTRRQFARAATGTAVLGGALGSGLLRPALAGIRWEFAPVPIPAGGGPFHVFPPGFNGVPIDAEPATITNFNGFVGLSYPSGMVTQANTKTGEVLKLPFLDSDMRFMQGEFVGANGVAYQGTFALV